MSAGRHHRAREGYRIGDPSYRADRARRETPTVHDGGIEFYLAISVQAGPPSGVEGRLVFEHSDRLLARFHRRATSAQRLPSGQRRPLDPGLSQLNQIRCRLPCAAVDQDDGPWRVSGHWAAPVPAVSEANPRSARWVKASVKGPPEAPVASDRGR